jgi:F-type H+-transporting ATPase subunit b
MHELIAPTINFTILVLLLVYFLRKPVREMISSRHLSIKKFFEEAQLQKAEAERKYREFSEKLNAFEAEAKKILETARADGETLKNKIVKDAHATAERIIKETELTAKANIQDYKDQIRQETIDRAVTIAEKIIRERLSTEDQRRMVNEYVGKVE